MDLNKFTESYLKAITEEKSTNTLNNEIKSVLEKLDKRISDYDSLITKAQEDGKKDMVNWYKKRKKLIEKSKTELAKTLQIKEDYDVDEAKEEPMEAETDNESTASDHIKLGILAILGKSKISDLEEYEEESVNELINDIINMVKDAFSDQEPEVEEPKEE